MACDVLCSSLSFRLHSLTVFWEIHSALTVQGSVISQNWSCVHHWALPMEHMSTVTKNKWHFQDNNPPTQPPPPHTTAVMSWNHLPFSYFLIFFTVSEKPQLKMTLGNHNTTLHIQRCRGFHVRQNSQCSHILRLVSCASNRRKLCTSNRRKLIFWVKSVWCFGSSGSLQGCDNCKVF